MFTENAVQEFEFSSPSEANGYHLFPSELEDDRRVLFHATPKRNLESILNEGFRARPPLNSVSYAKSSTGCLAHLFAGGKSLSEEVVVVVVRFESLAQQGIQENISDIHVYKSEIQPAIIGYCTIPLTYEHT